MVIPQPAQLQVEDFDKSVRPWIGRLISPLNSFITNVSTALNGRLAFGDNVIGLTQTLTFKYASNTLPLPLKVSFIPSGLQIIAATENGSPIIALAALTITASGSSATVSITDLALIKAGVTSQLTVGKTYSLTVRVS